MKSLCLYTDWIGNVAWWNQRKSYKGGHPCTVSGWQDCYSHQSMWAFHYWWTSGENNFLMWNVCNNTFIHISFCLTFIFTIYMYMLYITSQYAWYYSKKLVLYIDDAVFLVFIYDEKFGCKFSISNNTNKVNM